MQTALDPKDIPVGMAGVGFAFSIGATISISVSQNVFANLLRAGLDAGDVIKQGATGFLEHVADDQKGLVVGIHNSEVTRTFWIGVAAACVGLVAALCMRWNSVKAPRDREV